MCGYGCGLSEMVHFIYDPLALGRAKQMDCWMKCIVLVWYVLVWYVLVWYVLVWYVYVLVWRVYMLA